MKYLIILVAAPLIMSSCSTCDTSTAEGAGDCYCDLYEEHLDIEARQGDQDQAREELDERGEKWEDEVEAHIEAGDYTKDAVEQAMEDAGCKGRL